MSKKLSPEDDLDQLAQMQKMLADAAEARRKAQEQVKQFLFSNYEPSDSLTEGISMTTTEIYDRLQEHYPSEAYTTSDVASWMQAEGFETVNKGDLKLEWMMKKRA